MSVSDPRITPANGRVAARSLEGKVAASKYVDPVPHQCTVAAADITGKPDGRRGAQLLYGDVFDVLETRGQHVFGQSIRDQYCGYVRKDMLGPVFQPTHWVGVPATHLYPMQNVKAMTQGALYMGSEVRVSSEKPGWAMLENGLFAPSSHLLPLHARMDDPVGIADLFLGTPYLWGGSTRYGIDCSGLIQLAYRVGGRDCPRDSDMQEAQIGEEISLDQAAKGDLIFWKGHVAFIAGDGRILHANAHHMSVVYESMQDAIARIEEQGGGPVTSVKRP